jgi:hypothetical protein
VLLCASSLTKPFALCCVHVVTTGAIALWRLALSCSALRLTAVTCGGLMAAGYPRPHTTRASWLMTDAPAICTASGMCDLHLLDNCELCISGAKSCSCSMLRPASLAVTYRECGH